MCRKLICLFSSVLFFGLFGSAAWAQENQIINGEFANGLDSWGIYNYQNRVDATGFSVEVVQDAGLSGRNAVMIDITNASSVSSIGIAQSGLIVESGVSYPIGFIARAEQDREMMVLLQANINNQSWPTYLAQRVQLTTSPKTFVIEYSHGGSTIGDDPEETLTLYLMLKGAWWNMEGNNLNKKVWIDQVYFGAKSPPEHDPIIAFDPSPADEQTDVPRDVVLSWMPGLYSDKHDVYFGTVFSDVNDAIRTDPRDVLVSKDQEYSNYDPFGFAQSGPADLLEYGRTYYWRIDEVNAPPDSTIHKGQTWSFTVEPFAYQIENITATASSSFSEDMGPEKTIDGSGLHDGDLHWTEVTDMWISSDEGPQPTWIKYEFVKEYKLHEMWVWNSNQSIEPSFGFGLRNVTIEYSLDDSNWTQLEDVPEFKQATGSDDYTYNTTVNFDGVVAKYVRITANTNWGELLAQYGLSEVRFFYIPVRARLPQPASGGTGVALDAVLNWRAGRDAAVHEVYFSSDMGAVENNIALADTVSQSSFALDNLGPFDSAQGGLELGKTYYWKVNEVNEADIPSSWEGEVWSFTAQEYLVVDDFEDYDDLCNRIFYAWVDGFGHSGDPECGVAPYGGNSTGSTVGNYNAPFAEQTIVHEGRQSMPLGYNNISAPYYSEIQRQWAVAQDWTKGGVGSLTVWFYGEAGNNIAEQLYIAVEDSAGNIKVVSSSDPEAIQTASWQEWNIPFTSFAGVNIASVKTMYIGIGNRTAPAAGGTGKLYIDDVRLSR